MWTRGSSGIRLVVGLFSLLAAARPGAAAVPTLEAKARAFVTEHASAYGVRDPGRELRFLRNAAGTAGGRRLEYQQLVLGVPVYGAGLHLHFDAQGALRTVRARIIPAQPGSTVATTTAHEAEDVARLRAGADSRVAPATLEAAASGPYVFRTNLASRAPGTDHLAYRVEVRGAGVHAFVFVDAQTRKVVEVHAGVLDTIHREVRDHTATGPILWTEGDALPSTTGPALDGIVVATGATYDFYQHLTAGTWPSYDAHDHAMKAVYDWDSTQCPNAQFDGEVANFCAGFATFDVVAHEWSHGYTGSSDGLVYQWQPGALNEAYSDLFGESIGLVNAVDPAESSLRQDGRCSAASYPVQPMVRVTAPAALANQYALVGPAVAGTDLSQLLPLTGTLATPHDLAADPGDACGGPLTNTAELAGKVVVVKIVSCNVANVLATLQAAGALAAIVWVPESDTPTAVEATDVTLPAVLAAWEDGEDLAAAAGAQVSLFIPARTEPLDPSARWLIRSDPSVAFFRDDWRPECHGGPAKVSDASYGCMRSDYGGVHVNSSVVAHAYALLVDGGTFNGETLTGIGLARAAKIYWEARSFQDPYTDFPEHADALDAACAALVGTAVPDLQTGLDTAALFTAADCEQVAAAARAVELRRAPACPQAPLLAQSPPALCSTAATLFADDFETDQGWTVEHHRLYTQLEARDWERISDLPGGRSGTAFFAFGGTPSTCLFQNYSGTMSLTSPVLTAPLDLPLHLAFEHYVATEAGQDGGVLRVRVGSGDWAIVPAAAFTYNAYNATLAGPPSSTNPLAGLAAFSGTDARTFHGSWGQSQVDLSSLVPLGASFQLQFELGVDICNGIDGWYVDDVKLYTCPVVVLPKADGGGCAGVPAPGLGAALLMLALARLRGRRGR